jgi:hypothetical protein
VENERIFNPTDIASKFNDYFTSVGPGPLCGSEALVREAKAPLSYTILLEDLLCIKKCRQKHGRSYAISMTTLPKFSW